MSKIEEFKTFVKDNPSLIKFVKNNEMTWQKFYEIYDIYGNEESAWSEFISKDKKIDEPIIENSKNNTTTDFMSWIKGIDLESVREGVNSIQRVIGVLQDFNTGKTTQTNEYKPRPLYKHFED